MKNLWLKLTTALSSEGYTCIGPETVQSTGIKPYLFKPQETLWKVVRNQENKLTFVSDIPVEKQALLGVFPCDVRAMLIQDKVFLGKYPDPYYQSRREGLFVVALNCTSSGPYCFCLSTGGSMHAYEGFDLAITPVGYEVGFVEAGSEKGHRLLEKLQIKSMKAPDVNYTQTKQLPKKNIQAISKDELLCSKAWDEVVSRCLGCGACTQACPTCFCHKQEHTENTQKREWDSCFSDGHSFVNGASLLKTKKDRYQKWLTHKFIDWKEQFGVDGCVGCGRCIAWCPVGIDVVDTLCQLTEKE